MLVKQRREADARKSKQLGGKHRIKETVRLEPAEVVQQPEVEIAPVHNQVLLLQNLPKRVEFQAWTQHIDEEHLSVHQELEEAHPRLIMVHVVRLGIEGQLVNFFDG